MADDLFDIERLRKKWEPRQEEAAPVVHRALAQVGVARNPLREAREVLARMEALTVLRFPAQRVALGAFFREARELLEAHQRGLEARATQAAPAPAEQAPAGEPPPAPLVTLQATLDRLEELLEVFALELEPGTPSRRR
jgi:hypothetical protein